MLLACCLSNISVQKGQNVIFSGGLWGIPGHATLVSIGQNPTSTHLWAQSFRYFWRDRRRRRFWETLRGEQRTCCRWVPTQMLWCFLERQKQTIDQAFIFLWETIVVTLYVFYVLTLHLHHINRNLLLSHAEDFKVGDHTLKRIEKIKLAFEFFGVFFTR